MLPVLQNKRFLTDRGAKLIITLLMHNASLDKLHHKINNISINIVIWIFKVCYKPLTSKPRFFTCNYLTADNVGSVYLGSLKICNHIHALPFGLGCFAKTFSNGDSVFSFWISSPNALGLSIS